MIHKTYHYYVLCPHLQVHPLSPSSCARDRESILPPHWLPSPNGSHSNFDGMESSYREAPSVALPSFQDRLCVALGNVPHECPREHTQWNDPTPSDTRRHNPPWDTERSSTTSTLSTSSPVLSVFAPSGVEGKACCRHLVMPWKLSYAI